MPTRCSQKFVILLRMESESLFGCNRWTMCGESRPDTAFWEFDGIFWAFVCSGDVNGVPCPRSCPGQPLLHFIFTRSLFWFSFATPAKPTIARVGSRHGARGARIVREKLVIGSCTRLLLEPPEPGADGRSRPTPSSRSGSRPSRQNHERIFSSTFFSFSFAQARGSRRRARRGGPRGKRNNSSPL